MTNVPFTPLGDRVVIKADVEDRAPTETASGLMLAKTLSAAVEGSDVEDSWFVGTIVAVGPLVTQFNIRPYVLRRLKELWRQGCDTHSVVATPYLSNLIHDIEALPTDCPDPVKLGDRVTFSWASGQQITVDGDRFLIMRASDVLAVLEE